MKKIFCGHSNMNGCALNTIGGDSTDQR